MSGRAVMSSGLAPSRRLGRYTVVDCIGRGGMGEVWLATVEGPGGFRKHVVLKTVRPDLAEREDLVDSLIREAALAARLSHPNLVQVFDLDCVSDTYFFAMEYVPGRTLAAVLREAASSGPALAAGSGRIPVASAAGTVAPWFLASVVASACDGLHHAHELVDDTGRPLGLVHRDVSPGNIMVASTGNVVVLDFGIAIAAHGAQTETGVLKGKFQYMSPERIRGMPADRRCDVYALGVILYLGLTGHSPYSASGEYDLIQQIASGPPPLPSARRPLLPVALERICMTAMAYDPAQRYHDAAALASDLRDWLRAQGEHPTPDDVARYCAQLFCEVPANGPPRPPTDLSLAERSSDAIAIDVDDLESVHERGRTSATRDELAPRRHNGATLTPRRIAEERILTGIGRPVATETPFLGKRTPVPRPDGTPPESPVVSPVASSPTIPLIRDDAPAPAAPPLPTLPSIPAVPRHSIHEEPTADPRQDDASRPIELPVPAAAAEPEPVVENPFARPPEPRPEARAVEPRPNEPQPFPPHPFAAPAAPVEPRPPILPPGFDDGGPFTRSIPRPTPAVDDAPFTRSIPRPTFPRPSAAVDDAPFTRSIPRPPLPDAVDDAPFTRSIPRPPLPGGPGHDPFEAAPKPGRAGTSADVFDGGTKQGGDPTRWPWSR